VQGGTLGLCDSWLVLPRIQLTLELVRVTDGKGRTVEVWE
jgi:hypothetical protein